MKKTKVWLINDLYIFKDHYLSCDSKEKKNFKKGLFRYYKLKWMD